MSPDEKEREREKEKGCIKHKEGHSTVWIPVKLFWRTLSSSSPSPMLSQHTSPLEILCRSLKGVLLSLDFQTSCTPPPPSFHPPSQTTATRCNIVPRAIPCNSPFLFSNHLPGKYWIPKRIWISHRSSPCGYLSGLSLSLSLNLSTSLSKQEGRSKPRSKGKSFIEDVCDTRSRNILTSGPRLYTDGSVLRGDGPFFFSFYDKKRVKKRRIFGIIYFRPYRCCL